MFSAISADTVPYGMFFIEMHHYWNLEKSIPVLWRLPIIDDISVYSEYRVWRSVISVLTLTPAWWNYSLKVLHKSSLLKIFLSLKFSEVLIFISFLTFFHTISLWGWHNFLTYILFWFWYPNTFISLLKLYFFQCQHSVYNVIMFFKK